MAPQFLEIEHDSDRYRETLEIRDRILRAPLGLQFAESEIAAESTDFHLAAIDPEEDRVIACLVLTPVDRQLVHLRQVAVVEERRNLGTGRELTAFAERFARERGFRAVKLHAREPVTRFYEKLGYAITGKPFIEVSIPHRAMRKRLED